MMAITVCAPGKLGGWPGSLVRSMGEMLDGPPTDPQIAYRNGHNVFVLAPSVTMVPAETAHNP